MGTNFGVARRGMAVLSLLVVSSCFSGPSPEDAIEDVGAVAAELSEADAFHALVFNAAYYRQYDGDLAQMSDAQLRSHWLNYGINEGRRASAAFDVRAYSALNADLVRAYGATNYPALIGHYVRYGIGEGRNTAHDFFVREYVQLYPDLAAAFGTNFRAAASHWNTQGYPIEHRAGRVFLAPQIFSPERYRRYQPDMAGTSDRHVIDHWLNHGIAEGRRASDAFDVRYYREQNPDIGARFPANADLLRQYYDYGRAEGRNSAPDFHVKEYLQLYPDLAAAFGTNYPAAISHWTTQGRPIERRIGVNGAPRMLHRAGQDLVDDRGQRTLLRGVAFGNAVWLKTDTAPAFHHNEDDFERISEWGMNAVRFYLNYQWFESDANPGKYSAATWWWLDQNVAWARAHGVYLILNMHVPPGGYQSTGMGGDLWSDPANQKRLIDLWAAIAERYRDEPTVAGYDLLNEARPPVPGDWEDLAKRALAEVRLRDAEHLVFIERVLTSPDFPLLTDPKIVYEFHFYSRFEYTHQYADWVPFGEGGSYPGQTITNQNASWLGWSWDPLPPAAPPGNSDWAYYESPKYRFDDPSISIVRPNLMAENIVGTALFDDLVVTEYDPAGKPVRDVVQDPLENLAGFYYWVEPGGAGSADVSDDKHGGSHSLSITGTTRDSNLATNAHFFVPKAGHSYSVGVWIKGSGIAGPSACHPHANGGTQCPRALARLEYWSGGTFTEHGKAELEKEIQATVAWANDQQVPLYMGEFGVNYPCFENDRGGVRWVSDMLDIAEAHQLHFTYHAYHESNFAIFRSDATEILPKMEDANLPLIDLFKAKLQ